MTAITTIRIDLDTLPDQFDRSRPEVIADTIRDALREDGIRAEATDVIDYLRVEIPTTQLAATSAALADMQLI
jgi:hypothetical protein